MLTSLPTPPLGTAEEFGRSGRIRQAESGLLSGADAAIESVLLPDVYGERRIEGRGGDLPGRRIVGIRIAMIDQQSMEELEEVSGRAEVTQGVDELPLGEGRFEEVLERRGGARIGARPQPRVGDVVERFPGPLEGTHHILFVEPCLLEEVPILALDEPREFDGEHEFDAEAGVFEEFVVEEGPDQGPHAIRGAIDEVRFVDSVQQHDDAREAERLQQSLELGQQLVAIIGAQAVGQRLAGEFSAGKLHQRVPQFMSFAHADSHPPKNATCSAPGSAPMPCAGAHAARNTSVQTHQ